MNNYYFTSDKWYGPLEMDKPEFKGDYFLFYGPLRKWEKHLESLPSGPIAPELSKWAGQVKELGKDFVFEGSFPAKIAVPIADEIKRLCDESLRKLATKDQQKQMITEIMDADQRDGVYTDADLISVNPDYKPMKDKNWEARISEDEREMVLDDTLFIFDLLLSELEEVPDKAFNTVCFFEKVIAIPIAEPKKTCGVDCGCTDSSQCKFPISKDQQLGAI